MVKKSEPTTEEYCNYQHVKSRTQKSTTYALNVIPILRAGVANIDMCLCHQHLKPVLLLSLVLLNIICTFYICMFCK